MSQGNPINLYKYNLENIYKFQDIKSQRYDLLKKELDQFNNKFQKTKDVEIIKLTSKLYEKGFSGLDIMHILDNNHLNKKFSEEEKYDLLFTFQKVRSEFRNEKLFILFILNHLYL
jgi:hypothetical protein